MGHNISHLCCDWPMKSCVPVLFCYNGTQLFISQSYAKDTTKDTTNIPQELSNEKLRWYGCIRQSDFSTRKGGQNLLWVFLWSPWREESTTIARPTRRFFLLLALFVSHLSDQLNTWHQWPFWLKWLFKLQKQIPRCLQTASQGRRGDHVSVRHHRSLMWLFGPIWLEDGSSNDVSCRDAHPLLY